MTPEQRRMSEERAEFHLQELPPWDDFEVNSVDENYERRQPTPEQREQMIRTLEELGDLMAGTDARWQLDGAMNISLYGGDFIGVHKDTDISVEPEDLPSLEGHLLRRGFALFESQTRDDVNGPRRLKRVSADQVRRSGGENVAVNRVDERGKIIPGGDLNSIDLHLIRRDAEGRGVGNKGTPLPERWMFPSQRGMSGGPEISTSHPARTLYYKLYQGRNYDFTDLDRLAETGVLTEQDIDEVEQVLGGRAGGQPRECPCGPGSNRRSSGRRH